MIDLSVRCSVCGAAISLPAEAQPQPDGIEPVCADCEAGIADMADMAAEGQPCADCGCEPGERASGDDGDGVRYLAWACMCVCHEPVWMEDQGDE
ncbi:MAG: hypothetical protein IVW57_03195 [Ktedonobacterales bacterium]|nr:hypothetical protein [Ktedonobacterales bacterium]